MLALHAMETFARSRLRRFPNAEIKPPNERSLTICMDGELQLRYADGASTSSVIDLSRHLSKWENETTGLNGVLFSVDGENGLIILS